MNSSHANRHKLAEVVSENDNPVHRFRNPTNGREGRIIVKGENVFVVVVDALGSLVTKFCRHKPAHGGVPGTAEYLKRNGYEEE